MASKASDTPSPECIILRSAEEVEHLSQAAPGLFAGKEHLPEIFAASLTGDWAPRVVVARLDGAIAGILYSREKTVWGIPTGLLYVDTSLDGMLSTGCGDESVLFPVAMKTLLGEPGTRGIRLTVARDSVERNQVLETARSMSFKVAETEGYPHARLKLPLTYESFLEKLGYKSRRNFRYYRRNFETTGHSYVERIEPGELPPIVEGLRTKCRFSGGDIRRHVETCLRAQRPLIAGLKHQNGEWLGVVGGWCAPRQATVLFQLHNDLDFERESLSVVLRAYLLETLIGRQTEELIFLNNVAGPLARYVDTQWVQTATIYLDRASTVWRMVCAVAKNLGPLMPEGIGKTLAWIAPPAARPAAPLQSREDRNTKNSGRIRIAAVFLLLFAVALGWQFRQGAYAAEFASNPDEPSHLVTGLMVRDYLVHGLKENPLSYARAYYDHYPKVAMGHWPPLFYLGQAVWMLVFSRSGWAVLVSMAALCGITATILFRILQPRLGPWAAALAGLIFVSLPAIQTFTGELMTELPVILFTFSATLLFGCYLNARDTRTEWKYAIWFGIASSCAIMTKGSGFVLALLPVCAVLQSRRPDLPRRMSFYAPAVLVIALCLPWYLLAPDARHESVDPFGGLHPSLRALLIAPIQIFGTTGLLLAPLALTGFARALRRGAGDEQAKAAAAMLSSLALFRCFVEVARDARVLTIAIPPMLILAALGLSWLLSLPVPGFRLKWHKAGLACALAGATILWGGMSAPHKPRLGYRSLVDELRQRPEWRKPVTLIVADAAGEGAFISEIALRESAMAHKVIRSSKFLSQSDWSGSWRRAVFPDTASLTAAIRAAHIGLVVVDLVSIERDPQSAAARNLVQASRNPSFGTDVPLTVRQDRSNPDARRFLVFAVH